MGYAVYMFLWLGLFRFIFSVRCFGLGWVWLGYVCTLDEYDVCIIYMSHYVYSMFMCISITFYLTSCCFLIRILRFVIKMGWREYATK